MKLDSAVFYSSNIEAVERFYVDVLGFDLEARQGDAFISFIFPNARLSIKKAVEEREVPGKQTVFIDVDNAASLFDELKKKGVTFLKELTEETWGKNFSVADPDSNKVQFVEKQ